MADWPDGPVSRRRPRAPGSAWPCGVRSGSGKRWACEEARRGSLGIIPHVRYQMTRRDLLEGNADLMEKAGEVLAQGTPRTLEDRSGDLPR